MVLEYVKREFVTVTISISEDPDQFGPAVIVIYII